MATRTIEVDGRRWRVSPSGRRTQYTRDEFGLVFSCRPPDGGGERRICRFSPQGAKNVEQALAGLSDGQLADLLRRAQPAHTSPELGYGR